MEYIFKKITGKHKELESSVLHMMRLEYKALLRSWGAGSPEVVVSCEDQEMPLWLEVEFLENIIQFEVDNNPFLQAEVN